MTPTELLDRAADFVRAEKRVVIIASGPSQREVIRKGLFRRLNAAELERVALVTSVVDAQARSFDELLVTDEALKRVPPADRQLVATLSAMMAATQP